MGLETALSRRMERSRGRGSGLVGRDTKMAVEVGEEEEAEEKDCWEGRGEEEGNDRVEAVA